MILRRHSENPILLPISDSPWESENVFNPSVIHDRGLFHMHYRGQGEDWISRIGYAVSTDGVHFNRMREAVFSPTGAHDARGVEDPRVTKLDDSYYMTYTAYGPRGGGSFDYGGGVTPMVAQSWNLITWEPISHIVEGEDNKDHVLFPRKIGGRYAAFHRRRPDVWIAYSDDLRTWDEADMSAVYGPRPDSGWDTESVGSNGVPIETGEGWLCVYHGYDEEKVYRLGTILLDLDDPTRVIARGGDPILAPKEIYEVRGDVPNVVFSNANPVVGDTVYVYYGGADHVTCLSTCMLSDLLDYTLAGKQ
jgi:predicted GH43/DUF377 family glycosyl hydrolase